MALDNVDGNGGRTEGGGRRAEGQTAEGGGRRMQEGRQGTEKGMRQYWWVSTTNAAKLIYSDISLRPNWQRVGQEFPGSTLSTPRSGTKSVPTPSVGTRTNGSSDLEFGQFNLPTIQNRLTIVSPRG
jgi:hypothetical protein